MAKTKPIPKRDGTQSIARAAFILRISATRPRAGWGLTELAQYCRLDKATTHRIVRGLIRERLLLQREPEGHYYPGPLLYELGLSVASYAHFVEMCAIHLARLAGKFKAVATLTLRSGDDGVYAARLSEATWPISTGIGFRRPLALSCGGVAILNCLEDSEAKRIADYSFSQLPFENDTRLRTYKTIIQQGRRRGFVISEGVTAKGISVFAVAIKLATGRPLGGLTLSGLQEEFPAQRVDSVIETLKTEADSIAHRTVESFADTWWLDRSF